MCHVCGLVELIGLNKLTDAAWLKIVKEVYLYQIEFKVGTRQGWGARALLSDASGAGAGAIKIFGSSSSYRIIEKL